MVNGIQRNLLTAPNQWEKSTRDGNRPYSKSMDPIELQVLLRSLNGLAAYESVAEMSPAQLAALFLVSLVKRRRNPHLDERKVKLHSLLCLSTHEEMAILRGQKEKERVSNGEVFSLRTMSLSEECLSSFPSLDLTIPIPCRCNSSSSSEVDPLDDSTISSCETAIRQLFSQVDDVQSIVRHVARLVDEEVKKSAMGTEFNELAAVNALILLLLFPTELGSLLSSAPSSSNDLKGLREEQQLTDETFHCLYATSSRLIESVDKRLQTIGLLLMLKVLLQRSSSSLLTSLTPALPSFLLTSLRCVAGEVFHPKLLAMRCLSTVIAATSTTKSSLFFANQLLHWLQKSLRLHRQPSTVLPLLLALQPFLLTAESAILLCNMDIVLEILLSSMNVWHLPVQRAAVLNLAIYLTRISVQSLLRTDRSTVSIITGELLRIFSFYAMGHKDISTASPESVKQLMDDVVCCGHLLWLEASEVVEEVIACLQDTSCAQSSTAFAESLRLRHTAQSNTT